MDRGLSGLMFSQTLAQALLQLGVYAAFKEALCMDHKYILCLLHVYGLGMRSSNVFIGLHTGRPPTFSSLAKFMNGEVHVIHSE